MQDDPLSRWLAGDGPAILDAVTAEAMDVIVVIDRDLKTRYINWTGPGVTRDSVLGGSVVDLVPPDYRDAARAAYASVFRTGAGTSFETMFRDGEDVRMWEVRVGPIRIEGEVVGLIGITTNVTERRRAEADRDRFFSLSLDMLVVGTPDGHFKRLNPAFGEALGYDVSDLVGTPFLDIVHPDDRARTREAYLEALRGTNVTDFENRCRRRDGEYRVFSWRGTVDPVTRHVYAVARDLTDYRATEAQLRHAQKMDAIGKLAGGVAHDFNNLLLAILANAQLAAGTTPPASKVAEHLHEIESAGRRAATLTKQLLAFSRRQELHPVPVDLNELIGGLMQMLRRLLPESIAVDLIAGPDLTPVSADPTQLEQIIVNLCLNARDAMPGGGKLTIETESVAIEHADPDRHPGVKPGGYALLTVTDTGVGMSPDVRERVFEPFFTTKDDHRGTGLGLATVYGIVQQHAGMVRFDTEVGEGTRFSVYLPADAQPAQGAREERRPAPAGGSETILLAEDEELVRRPLVQALQAAGYRTLAASNGLEAIRVLREAGEPIHLVLLDVVMPELGGPETWERMRALSPELRVLFTSGYADARYLERLPPDTEVLQKPFRTEDLLARIRQELDA